MAEANVIHVPEQRRFEIHVGDERAGLAEYVDKGGRRFFVHTEIADDHEGEGLGSQLVAAALDATRAEHVPVVPLCPFVAGWIDRHPEYADLVDRVVLDQLDRGT